MSDLLSALAAFFLLSAEKLTQICMRAHAHIHTLSNGSLFLYSIMSTTSDIIRGSEKSSLHRPTTDKNHCSLFSVVYNHRCLDHISKKDWSVGNSRLIFVCMWPIWCLAIGNIGAAMDVGYMLKAAMLSKWPDYRSVGPCDADNGDRLKCCWVSKHVTYLLLDVAIDSILDKYIGR